VFFPDNDTAIPNTVPELTFVVLDPLSQMWSESTKQLIENWTNHYGQSARRFKNAIIWCVADDSKSLRDVAKKKLAWDQIWEDVETEFALSTTDDVQKRMLSTMVENARKELKETVWRSYRYVVYLNSTGELERVDLGLPHSSAASTPLNFILSHLEKQGDAVDRVGINFILRNWSSAFDEWGILTLRNAFFASPRFPRLLNPSTIKSTIAKGVADGQIAYVSRLNNGIFEMFRYRENLQEYEIEFSDEVAIIRSEDAEAYIHAIKASNSQDAVEKAQEPSYVPEPHILESQADTNSTLNSANESVQNSVKTIWWEGEINPQKWILFYNRVLSRFANQDGLRLKITFEFNSSNGISEQKINETRSALRDLGFDGTSLNTSEDTDDAQ
jgi:hypothetical protein